MRESWEGRDAPSEQRRREDATEGRRLVHFCLPLLYGLGRASPSTSSCLPFPSSFAAPRPVVSLPPSCYKGSRLINRKNHEETIGRVSRIVEETLETCRPLDRREGMLWRAAAPAPSSCGHRFLPTAVHASFDQLHLHLVPSWGNSSRVPPDPPA